MSLLEDVFLEDEAGEAQDLERIIEGDEIDDERPRSRADDSDENSAKEDEAEEEKVRVDPTSAKPKRVTKNPRFVLNPARLTGPRGIQVLPEHFKDFKFKGKGHEKNDLDLVLKKLEHWAYRLYPKFQFEDCLKKIETLGKKRAVAVHLTKLRMDMITSDETVVQKDSSEDEAPAAPAPEEDEFDKLLQQQIEIARSTPAPSSVKKTPFADRSLLMPRATSSPSINDEQRERMLRNRQMAEERRLAKLKQNTSQENSNKNTAEYGLNTNNVSTGNGNLKSGDKLDVINDAQGKTDNIVELDDNGIVVSPNYIPAKKHNKCDVGIGNNVTNDINDKDIMEIDNDQVTKCPRTYVPAKKHNRSRIDSSDDNASEPVIVDLENHHDEAKRLKIYTNNSKANIKDLSDDENVSEPIIIDVGNHHNSSERTHRSNVDSSDEDEPLVMNESITVDIHDNNKDETNSKKYDNSNTSDIKSNKIETNENDNVFDSLITTNTENKNIVEVSKEAELHSNKTNLNSINVSNNSNIEMEKSAESVQNSDKNQNRASQKDDEEQKEKLEELMDVDFSDDF